DNLEPSLTKSPGGFAFALGLLHGFGFAASLGDLGLRTRDVVRALGGVTLGVELGQCVIVLFFVPSAFLLRRSLVYRGPAFVGGSVAIGGIAYLWLLERAL